LLVLGAYPIVSYAGGSVWTVAGGGALAALALCAVHGRGSPREILTHGVAWEILLFLFGIFVLAIGVRHVGLTGQLTDLYRHTGAARAAVVGRAPRLVTQAGRPPQGRTPFA